MRCLFIGMDSFDPDLLRKWVAEGRLPTIARLLGQGRSVETVTDPGTYVGSLWATIHTGVNPSTHGLYSWSRMVPGSYEFELSDEREIQSPSFWTKLSAAGVRCAVIDVPHCKLDKAINGLHVINWYTHFKTVEGFASQPPHVAAELEARFGLDPVPHCNEIEHSEAGLADFVAKLNARIEARTVFVAEQIASGQYDFVAVGYGESHCVGHQCYDPRTDRIEGNHLFEVYQRIDEAVGRLVAACPEGCEIVLLASHGMGPHYDGQHVADRLLRRVDKIANGAPAVPLARRMIELIDANRLRRFLGPLAKLLPAQQPRRAHGRAFTVENNTADMGIRVNLEGREPAGLVKPDDYDGYLDGLEALLMQARRPGETAPAFLRSIRTTRFYDIAPMDNPLPDLMLNWDRSKPFPGLEIPGVATVVKDPVGVRSGDHKEGGLAIFVGAAGHNSELPAVMQSHDLAGRILSRFGVGAS